MARKLVKRSDKVSFLGCLDNGTETFNRMRGFTTLSGSKNSIEYSRQYVDEEFEVTVVSGDTVEYEVKILTSTDATTTEGGGTDAVKTDDPTNTVPYLFAMLTTSLKLASQSICLAYSSPFSIF